jgi:hypothetical protein
VQTADAPNTIQVQGNESGVEHIRIANTNGYTNKTGIDIVTGQRLTFYDIFIEHSPRYKVGVNIPAGYYSQFMSCWIQGETGIKIGDESNRDKWIGVLDFNACHFNNSGLAVAVYPKDTNTICFDKCSFEGDDVCIENKGIIYVRNTYFGDQIESTNHKAVLVAKGGSHTDFRDCSIGLSAFTNDGRVSLFELTSDEDGFSTVHVMGGKVGVSNNFNIAGSQSSLYSSDAEGNIIYLDFVRFVPSTVNNNHNKIPFYIYDGYSPLRSHYPLTNYVCNGTMKSARENNLLLGGSTGLSMHSTMTNPFGGSVLKAAKNGDTKAKFSYYIPRDMVGEKMCLEFYLYSSTPVPIRLNAQTLGVSNWHDFETRYENERRPPMYRIDVVPTAQTGSIEFSFTSDAAAGTAFYLYGVILKEGDHKEFLSCYKDIEVPTSYTLNYEDGVLLLVGSDGSVASADIKDWDYTMTDVAVAIRSNFETGTGTLQMVNSNADAAVCCTTANNYRYTDREDKAVYVIPVDAKAKYVTVTESSYTGTKTYNFIGMKESNGSLVKVFESGFKSANTYTWERGSISHMAIVIRRTDGTSWSWGYDDSKVTVAFSNHQ